MNNEHWWYVFSCCYEVAKPGEPKARLVGAQRGSQDREAKRSDPAIQPRASPYKFEFSHPWYFQSNKMSEISHIAWCMIEEMAAKIGAGPDYYYGFDALYDAIKRFVADLNKSRYSDLSKLEIRDTACIASIGLICHYADEYLTIDGAKRRVIIAAAHGIMADHMTEPEDLGFIDLVLTFSELQITSELSKVDWEVVLERAAINGNAALAKLARDHGAHRFRSALKIAEEHKRTDVAALAREWIERRQKLAGVPETVRDIGAMDDDA